MILVTGTSGFIGKHLLRALVKKYGPENIVALTSVKTTECNFLLHEGYSFDKDFFKRSPFNEITTVIHAGAFIPKKAVDADDIEGAVSNINGTLNLLKALPQTVKNILFLSTVDVYGFAEIITEDTAVLPVSLYAHSKYYCEIMIAAWAKKNNKQLAILRIGHVYGPGEEAYQKVIPVTINKLLQNGQPQILGEGNEKRAFIHVKDVVKAIMNAVELDSDPGPVNIVGAQSVSIKELVTKLISISGMPLQPEFISHSGQGRNLLFDNKKMAAMLGSESVDLDKGLQEEWDYMMAINS